VSPPTPPAARAAVPRAALLPRRAARPPHAAGRRVVDRACRRTAGRRPRLEWPRHARAAPLRALRRLHAPVALAAAVRDDVRAVARDGALRHLARQLDMGVRRAVARPHDREPAARRRRLLLRAGPAGGERGGAPRRRALVRPGWGARVKRFVRARG